MGTFTTLKTNGHADKVVKFKQGVLASAANSAGTLSTTEFTIAKGGICAAMSMQWLKERMSFFTFFSDFQRSKGVSSSKDTASQKTLAKNIAPFDKFGKTWASSGFNPAYKELAKHYSLNIDTTNFVRGTSVLAAAQAVKAVLKKKQGNLFTYEMIPTAAHATALYLDGDGVYHFFDPNAGEYKLKNDKFDEFFTEYYRILNSSFGWTITKMFCFECSQLPWW